MGTIKSWQPALISDKDLYEAQDMAEKSYGGTWWCWTFELGFLLMMGFTELSPRPHDTGMVTLAEHKTSMNLNCIYVPY
jgi:phosphoribosylglycinamide formyltransferase 2